MKLILLMIAASPGFCADWPPTLSKAQAQDVPAPQAARVESAVPVRLAQHGRSWTLTRGGAPYFIRGGGPDAAHMEQMKSYGGNSVRTWGSDRWQETLYRAQQLDMTVLAGYWLKHRGQGFDYGDPAQVAAQNQEALEAVRKFKGHPALLAWGLGNEMENGGDDPQVWTAVESLARAIKRVDPNHPIVTVVADFSPQKIRSIMRYAPDVDILGVNSYGGVMSVKTRLEQAGWRKPYIMTEYGPPGGEAARKTSWGAALEPSSTEKAAHYRDAYEAAVAAAPDQCLGSYVFKWGSKDEGTRTWHGMLLPDTEETLGAVDAVSELWTGHAPRGTAPEITGLTFSASSKAVARGSLLHACLDAHDRAGLAVEVSWVLAEDKRVGADVARFSGRCAHFPAPAKPGAYRLYAEARDGRGHGATVNAPFLVQ